MGKGFETIDSAIRNLLIQKEEKKQRLQSGKCCPNCTVRMDSASIRLNDGRTHNVNEGEGPKSLAGGARPGYR